jgi:hypothetical protein
MRTAAAPRLDDRLRRYISERAQGGTAAEVTRADGSLAWELGLPRPSYQTVRLSVLDARGGPAKSRMAQTSRGTVILNSLWEYPGPGLARWYERYKHGGGL